MLSSALVLKNIYYFHYFPSLLNIPNIERLMVLYLFYIAKQVTVKENEIGESGAYSLPWSVIFPLYTLMLDWYFHHLKHKIHFPQQLKDARFPTSKCYFPREKNSCSWEMMSESRRESRVINEVSYFVL